MSNSIKHTIHKNCDFTIISNGLINDDRLQLDERMLVIWAISKPEGWRLNTKAICTQLNLSIEKLTRITKKLRDTGYLSIKRHASGVTEWHWYEVPHSENQNKAEPHSENPNVENPNVGFQNVLERTDLKERTDLVIKDISSNAQQIFNHWIAVMGKPATVKFTEQRKSCVKSRLKNYSVEEIKQAITNCAKSAFHMGQNDGGKVYDDLTLICRNDTKLEQFRDMTQLKPVGAAGSKTNYNLQQMQQFLSEGGDERH